MLNLQGQMEIIIRGEMKNEKLGRGAKLRRGAIFAAEKDGISRIRTDRCELRMKLEEIRSLLEISSNC